MPAGIFEQPIPLSLHAAYRPIIFRTYASTSTGAQCPAVYCDIYIDEIYYKTVSRTQPSLIANGTFYYDFDVQDAAQEYLQKYIADNGGYAMVTAPMVTAKLHCRFRATEVDEIEGFVTPDGPVPVQSTLTTAAVSGGGTESVSIWIINAALQHEDNQRLDWHLDHFKYGTWAVNVAWPLTHRPNRYLVRVDDNDYFPILSFKEPTSLKIHVTYKDLTTEDDENSLPCTPPSLIGTVLLPDAFEGLAYSYTFTLNGTQPFEIPALPRILPSWMSIELDGNEVTLSGTPDAPMQDQNIYFEISNCGGLIGFQDKINISDCEEVTGAVFFDPPDAERNKVYEYRYPLNGTPPFTILQADINKDWLSVEIVDTNILRLYGHPTLFNTNPFSPTASFIIKVGNCISGEATWMDSVRVYAPGATPTTGFSARTAPDAVMMLAGPTYHAKVYTVDNTLAVGHTVYTDSTRTTVLTGHNLIAYATSPSDVWYIDRNTGVIFEKSGLTV